MSEVNNATIRLMGGVAGDVYFTIPVEFITSIGTDYDRRSSIDIAALERGLQREAFLIAEERVREAQTVMLRDNIEAMRGLSEAIQRFITVTEQKERR